MTIGVLLVGHPAAAVAASNAPSISITPSSTGGQFADGQTVRVSVGPNSLFVPLSRVVILECADPGGDAAHLPVSLLNCDENTIQGDTTVVQSDGSFVESTYGLYALPSKTLGEQANGQPVCGPTSECVLFVGEDQNDFTQPKAFSRSFFLSAASPAGPSSPNVGAPGSAPTTSVVSAAPAVSAKVSLAPATLAFTGPSAWMMIAIAIGAWLAVAGSIMVLMARGLRR